MHEHIQLRALEQSAADGLLIAAVTEPMNGMGGWSNEAITRSYQMVIDSAVFPAGAALFGNFPTYARFSGPREWAFAALCEKNRGCSHFVVGPERKTSPEGEQLGRRRYFESLGDIGIVPLFVEPHAWHAPTRSFRIVRNPPAGEVRVGKHAREQLRRGRPVPEWLIRPEIQDMLRADLSAGRPVFAS